MQVDAIYDHGRVTFDPPIRLAKARFPVILDIPNSALLPESASADSLIDPSHGKPALAGGQQLLQEIRLILGPLSKRRTPASSAEDKAALSEALAEKYDR
jgi:hypothetical protein